jgi:hypothetical protein
VLKTGNLFTGGEGGQHKQNQSRNLKRQGQEHQLDVKFSQIGSPNTNP